MSDIIRGNRFETDKDCKCGRRHFVFNEHPSGDDILISEKKFRGVTSERNGNVLAMGCLLSVMAMIYTTIGFWIGWFLRGM